MEPVGTCCPSSERNFQASVELFDHTVGLGVIRGCLGHGDSKFSANSGLDGGYKLASSVQGQSGRNAVP